MEDLDKLNEIINIINESNNKDYQFKEIQKIVRTLNDKTLKNKLNNILNYDKLKEIQKIVNSLPEENPKKQLDDILKNRKKKNGKTLKEIRDIVRALLDSESNNKLNNILNYDKLNEIESLVKLYQNINLVIKKLQSDNNPCEITKLTNFETLNDAFKEDEEEPYDDSDGGYEYCAGGDKDFSSQIQTIIDNLKDVTNESPQELDDYVNYDNYFIKSS